MSAATTLRLGEHCSFASMRSRYLHTQAIEKQCKELVKYLLTDRDAKFESGGFSRPFAWKMDSRYALGLSLPLNAQVNSIYTWVSWGKALCTQSRLKQLKVRLYCDRRFEAGQGIANEVAFLVGSEKHALLLIGCRLP
jgi:hypothetical protein